MKLSHWTVIAAFCVLVGALAFLLVHPTIKIERETIIASTTTTSTVYVNPSLPGNGTYAQVKAQVLSASRASEQSAAAGASNVNDTPIASADCILPSSWAPGNQFTCITFNSSDSQNGTSTVSIESPDPDQAFTIVVSWAPYGFGP